MTQKGFAALLPIIVFLVAGVALVVVIIAIRQNASLSFLSKATSEEEIQPITLKPKRTTPSPSPSATPPATPKATKDSSPPPAAPEPDPLPPTSSEPLHTTPGWSYSGTGGVDVTVTPNSSKNTLFVDFESDSFTNISSIEYLLTYDATSSGPARGVQGTISSPSLLTPTGKYDNRPYIRRSITLGTCSRKACTYDLTPQNFKLTVTTRYKTGVRLTRVLETLYLP